MRAARISNTLGLRAIGLMAAWRRATSAHMALAGGVSCACGSAFDGLSSDVLERDLVLFIYEKHRVVEALQPVFERAGVASGGNGDLASLIGAITECPVTDEAALEVILDDLDIAITGLGASS